MDKSYCVYVHTAPNGKRYVGITSQKPEVRWKGGWGYRYCPRFWNAIQKYGWENFSHEIVQDGLSRFEAEDAERKYIEEFDTTNPLCGYNMTLGGESGVKFTDDIKSKISNGVRQRWADDEYRNRVISGHIGLRHSQETRRKMSQSHKRRARLQQPRVRESEVKVRQKSGATPRPVMCVETGQVYVSVTDASADTGATGSGIYRCCNGERKTAKGYRWQWVT